MQHIHVSLGIPDSKIEPCQIDIQGDVEVEGWPENLVRGVVELIALIDQMYGSEIVDEALKSR
jgi:hypothetical protein